MVLILYSAVVLSDLRASVTFPECFKHRILLSASQDNSFLPFPFVSLLFFLLSYCSGKILSTILNKGGVRGCSFFSPDFQRNAFKFSPLSIVLGIDLPYIGRGRRFNVLLDLCCISLSIFMFIFSKKLGL